MIVDDIVLFLFYTGGRHKAPSGAVIQRTLRAKWQRKRQKVHMFVQCVYNYDVDDIP